MALEEEFEVEGNRLFRYRSYLPIILLVAGVVVIVLTDGKSTPHLTLFEWACLAVSSLGLLVRVFTVGHTPAGTSGRNTKQQVADCLNTSGAYSIVRHPLYLGNFLLYLGIACLTQSGSFVLVFILVFWLYCERIMFAEEQFLRRKFGKDFIEWAVHTPAFIPAFGKYKSSKFSFSWKKVLKKEKNGIFALFLVFCLFDVIIRMASGQTNVNISFIVMAVLTGVAYLVLDYLKKHTHVLDEEGR